MKKFETLKTLLYWVTLAFFMGMALRGGAKTLDHLWPEKNEPIIIKHEYKVAVEGGENAGKGEKRHDENGKGN